MTLFWPLSNLISCQYQNIVIESEAPNDRAISPVNPINPENANKRTMKKEERKCCL